MSDFQMATVKAVSSGKATVELGSGEIKTASVPRNLTLAINYKILVTQVSGKYLIIHAY